MRASLAFLALIFCALPALGQGPGSCARLLDSILHFDASTIDQASDENPIAILLAEDLHQLRGGLREKIHLLPAEWRPGCSIEAQALHGKLAKLFRARLARLVGEGDPEAFIREYQTIFAPITDPRERDELRAAFGDFEPSYLTLVHRSLLASLEGGTWSRYARIEVKLESWGEEWSRLLEREAPAGVELASGRVGLRPLEHPLPSLRIFLFHELSHLACEARSELENEICAWGETVRYLDTLTKPLPSPFEGIRANIRLIGLRRWVKLVVVARSAAKPSQQ